MQTDCVYIFLFANEKFNHMIYNLLFSILLMHGQNFSIFPVKETYWYNLYNEDILLGNNVIKQSSYLELLCDTIILKQSIEIKAKDKAGKIVYAAIKQIDSDAITKKENGNNEFKCFVEVPYLAEPPSKIIIKLVNNKQKKQFVCDYFKLKGRILCNFTHKNAYLNIVPNDFSDPNLFLKIKKNYEILLPQRKYNAICAVADSYGLDTLESWAFNIIGKNEILLNYEIGNMELYNLHVWKNNGGGKYLFITFRPMCLQDAIHKKTKIGQRFFDEIDFNISLEQNNIKVRIDDETVDIIALQEYYEVGEGNHVMKSYIIQVEYDKNINNKLMSVNVDYNSLYGISFYYLH
jgi:hypothetical protein